MLISVLCQAGRRGNGNEATEMAEGWRCGGGVFRGGGDLYEPGGFWEGKGKAVVGRGAAKILCGDTL